MQLLKKFMIFRQNFNVGPKFRMGDFERQKDVMFFIRYRISNIESIFTGHFFRTPESFGSNSPTRYYINGQTFFLSETLVHAGVNGEPLPNSDICYKKTRITKNKRFFSFSTFLLLFFVLFIHSFHVMLYIAIVQ